MTTLGFYPLVILTMSQANSPTPFTPLLYAAISAIQPMAPDDMELILPVMTHKTLKKDGLLLRENEVCRHIFFLGSGLVRMYYLDESGHEINYRFTDAGHFFVDFQSFLTQQPSRYYWQALQDSEILLFPYTAIQQIYQRSPAWTNFGRVMAEHVYLQLNQRVEMLLFMKPEERYRSVVSTNPGLIKQVSLLHLSSYLGIKPESLSRIRKRMSAR